MFHVTLPAGSQLAAARLYADRAAVIRRLLGASALAAFNELDDYHDVGPFLDRMVPTSLAAQQALAGLLEGYVAAATEAEWDDVDVDVEQTTGDAVRPEGMEHTWSVPFFKMWGALEAGAEFADALADARASIERTAQTDLSIAQAETMSRLAARVPAVSGYRRVLGGDGCAFCVEASEQTYGGEDLMPLHPGCHCSVAPIVDGEDPAATLNAEETEGAD